MHSSDISSSSLPYYDGPLGAIPQGDGATFTTWAPTAEAVSVRLFTTSDPNEKAIATLPLKQTRDGAWSITQEGVGEGCYYDYLVRFPDGVIHRTSDPWGTASGVNGERSMVLDSSTATTTPDGWDQDVSPQIPLSATVIWETHIGDFSVDPDSGIDADHRGRYLAFTDESSHCESARAADGLDPSAMDADDDFPTGMSYLKSLGVTHVQIMPFYDYGSVDESTGDSYNWGYDPIAYNVPEGSYSSDPYDGHVRIRECRAMIQALHSAGFRVVMDVVYNHMYRADNAFERMVPGYFCRRAADGSLSNGSGCGNDMASEHPMFRRFIIDSLVHWVKDYHIDGFRFDLMGLIDVDTLNQARKRLDALDGGHDILMYGEPWSAGDTEVGRGVLLGRHGSTQHLDTRIGWFCDGTRDSIKGSVTDDLDQGYVNGRADKFATQVFHALNGWRGTRREPASVAQLIQYVSAHDDLTLWDKLCLSMREGHPTIADYDAERDVDDILEANTMAAGLILMAAGLPFMLSGEEFARTKYGCDNSFQSSAQLNMLNWAQARRMSGLTGWYRTLIAIRRTHPEIFDGTRERVASPSPVIAATTGSILISANPTDDDVVLRPEVPFEAVPGEAVPATYDSSVDDSTAWRLLADSRTVLAQTRGGREESQPGRVTVEALPISPAHSFRIWEAR